MKRIFTLLLAMCSTAMIFATQHSIDVSNNTYTPANLMIQSGDTINFNWLAGNHPTVADNGEFAQFPLDAGNPTFQLILHATGTIPYYCVNHGGPNGAGMAGTITVNDFPAATLTDCGDIFISEYIEGSSNNKAIEVYNPTAGDIDISNYTFHRLSNGGVSGGINIAAATYVYSGIIPSGGTYVIANSNADAAILAVKDTVSALNFYNGDDAIMITNAAGEMVDRIGVWGVDPGSLWDIFDDMGTDIGDTREFTLVRKSTILKGNTTWLGSADREWDVYAQNDFSFIGSHTSDCIVPVAPIVSFQTAVSDIDEMAGTATVSVTIMNEDANATSVDVSDLGTGTATAGTDYMFTATTLTFPANDMTTQTFMVTIVDDAIIDAMETIDFALSNVTNNATLNIDAHTLTINDNEMATVPVYTIGQIDGLDADCAGDSVGVTMKTSGIVHGINYRPSGLQFFINDGMDGIAVFNASGDLGYMVTEGDLIEIEGDVAQFRGLLQINPTAITLIAAGNAINTPTVVTMMDESTESEYTVFENATLVDPTQWASTGSYNVDVTNGTETIQLRIDSDMPFSTDPAPTGTFNVYGLGSQFNSSSTAPFCDGYQMYPTMFDLNIGILSIEQSLDLEIYPNPTSAAITINTTAKNADIIIYNNVGAEVSRVKANDVSTIVEMSNFAAGIYIIKIQNEEGQATTKVVKQ